MKLIDDKKILNLYFDFAKSGSYKLDELGKLPKVLIEIIETDKILKPLHLTHDLLRQYLEHLISKREPRYKPDMFCDPVINAICQWLRKDRAFLQLDPAYSFDKGIMLSGGVGTGKTLIMQSVVRLVCQFALNRSDLGVPYFNDIESYELAHGFSKAGYQVFDEGISRDRAYWGRINLFSSWLFIDDIGSEPIVSHYGNIVNIVGELLIMRYKSPYKTAGTTNLAVKALKEFYGQRVYSRMCEMFNFLTIRGNDRRTTI